MKKTFDYLENAAVSATVCDKDGIVVYQNKVAQNRDGAAIGKNLFKCHSPRSNEKIRHMHETGESNTYETIKHGKRHFIHHTPWREQCTMVQRFAAWKEDTSKRRLRPHEIDKLFELTIDEN